MYIGTVDFFNVLHELKEKDEREREKLKEGG
jgi:hypothetical protein